MAAASVTFERRDHGRVQLLKNLTKLSHGASLVGFPSGGPIHPDTGDNVASLALLHEFGSPANHLPARPFNRLTIVRTRKALALVREALYQQWMAGQVSTLQFLRQIGEWYTGQLKRTITEEAFVPLAPVTVARKKSSRPLIDTAFMRNSITHREIGV